MKRFVSLAMCLVLVVAFSGIAMAKDARSTVGRDYSGYNFVDDGVSQVLTSSSNGHSPRFKAGASADTFCLFGGGTTNEGRFQDGTGVVPAPLAHVSPDGTTYGGRITGVPDAERFQDWDSTRDWFGIDLSDTETFWQVSDGSDGSCNSGFDNASPTNKVWWCGRSAAQRPGWAHPPGYGNSWNAVLEYRKTTGAPGVGQTITLEFDFHHDTEPGYDFFNVQYDSAGVTTVNVLALDGNNSPFANHMDYPDSVNNAAITYVGGDYAGLGGNEVAIQMSVTSDTGWSDEDGLWSTVCGAAVVDDIRVVIPNDASDETTDVDTTNQWVAVKANFGGDFSHIHARLTDIDPCREDKSPVAAFIDFGQCASNEDNNFGNGNKITPDPLVKPGAGDCYATGGTPPTGTPYGIPGGWVVNYNSGLFGLQDLNNEVWSPEIEWDLAGTTADDAPEISGCLMRFSVWRHLPLLNGIFYVWHIRATNDNGTTWGGMDDRNFVYYSATGNWLNVTNVVTDLVVRPGGATTQVQVGLGAVDLAALFAFPGTAATPAPAFDNVAVQKFLLQGPTFATRNIDLFMEGFPQSGNTDFHTLAGRQASDCRFDMRDISTGNLNIPGDSITVDIVSAIPGATLDRIQLVWILDKNPKFDDARDDTGTLETNNADIGLSTITTIAGGAANGWDQWTGTTEGQQVVVNNVPIQDRFSFDLPDENFAHPGDVLRYYIEAEDSDGRITTLPGNTAGFADGTGLNGARYAGNFTINMLPSIIDDGQGGWVQPWILVVNDFGFRGGLNDYFQAFDQNGWRRGVEFDMYTVWGPSSIVSNGIGSQGAHGATPDQLSGYEVIISFHGDLSAGLFSDGSNVGQNDKGDDLGTITGWFNQSGDRFIASFGDDIASAHIETSPGAGGTYVSTVMGVDFGDNVVQDEIDGQTAPLVTPTLNCFVGDYVAYGGCLGLNEFDSIDALTGAVRSHEFINPATTLAYGGPDRAASVTWDRLAPDPNTGPDRKVSMTFPYGFVYVWNANGHAGPISARASLLEDIIEDCFQHAVEGTDPTAVDGNNLRLREILGFKAVPTPFNPSTKISFSLGEKQKITLRVYDVKGRLVRTLANEQFEAGDHGVVWNGRDDRGAGVASGVYLARIQGSLGDEHNLKLVMMK